MILTSSHSFFFRCGTRRANSILAAWRIWPTKRQCICSILCIVYAMTAAFGLDNTYKTNSQKQIHHHWMSSFTLHMAIEQPSYLSHLLRRNPQDATPGMDALADLEPYPLTNLMVGVTANPNRMPAALVKRGDEEPKLHCNCQTATGQKGRQV